MQKAGDAENNTKNIKMKRITYSTFLGTTNKITFNIRQKLLQEERTKKLTKE